MLWKNIYQGIEIVQYLFALRYLRKEIEKKDNEINELKEKNDEKENEIKDLKEELALTSDRLRIKYMFKSKHRKEMTK